MNIQQLGHRKQKWPKPQKKSNKAQNVSEDFEQPEMVTLKIVDR